MKRVIIDTDIGGDVDDAFAVSLALKSPHIQVEKILTCDSYSAQGARIAHLLCELTNKDVEVYQGKTVGDGTLIEDTIGNTYQVQSLKNNLSELQPLTNENLKFISLGNMRNIHYLLQEYPKIGNNWSYEIMGGSWLKDYDGRDNKIAEWNMKNNLTATRSVLQKCNNIRLFPLDVTWDLTMTLRDLGWLKAQNSLTKKLYEMCERLQSKIEQSHDTTPDITLHDPLVIYSQVNDICEWRESKVNVNSDGVLVQDPDGSRCDIAYERHGKEDFMRFVEDTLK